MNSDTRTEVHRKHDGYMEHVTKQSDGEKWINNFKAKFQEIEENADAFIENQGEPKWNKDWRWTEAYWKAGNTQGTGRYKVDSPNKW